MYSVLIHGDRHRLRRWGVPDDVISNLIRIEFEADARARAGGVSRYLHDQAIARAHRFMALSPERQRVARWFW